MSRRNPWEEVSEADVALYELPEGVVANCELIHGRTIYIGTSSGVYAAQYYSDVQLGSGRSGDGLARHIGLDEHNVIKIDLRGRNIVVWTAEEKVFTALDYVLSGRR